MPPPLRGKHCLARRGFAKTGLEIGDVSILPDVDRSCKIRTIFGRTDDLAAIAVYHHLQ
jgi:hypothetical protein